MRKIEVAAFSKIQPVSKSKGFGVINIIGDYDWYKTRINLKTWADVNMQKWILSKNIRM